MEVVAGSGSSSFGVHLQHWLTDKRARDQFLIQCSVDLEIYWNIGAGHLKPELFDHRTIFLESAMWSPSGTYLATTLKTGSVIWGGATFFKPLMFCDHNMIKLINFSVGEKYLVSYSEHDRKGAVLKIFDVKSGEVKMVIGRSQGEHATGGIAGISQVAWPIFRWSGRNDDKYFARIGKNAIYIYETNTFGLIDNETLKAENVMDFCWSPTDPVIALFVPTDADEMQPARVSLIHVPNKEELKKKNLNGVRDCKMFWQSNGEYLAVLFNQFNGTRSTTYQRFVIFGIKDPGIPVEDFELENENDMIIAFSWEPNGQRFAVIHALDQRQNVSFYSVIKAQNRFQFSKLVTLEVEQAGSLHWSPAGRFILLAAMRGCGGDLIFYDVDALGTLAIERFVATNIEWSPTGRYVATIRTLSDDLDVRQEEFQEGVMIWSFFGVLLYQIPRRHLTQFWWRPRPSPSSSTQEMQDVLEVVNELDIDLDNDLDNLIHFNDVDNKDKEVFTLSTEQLSTWKAPEGWDQWWTEIGRMMNKNRNAALKEPERKEEKLDG
ncbi:eukaryotic translation initiation factor 3 subunit B-like [Quercus robur]|uniref:eukaryotic translation initiation factor 3 subunit B-like n=1 Tax=Quercus robur TaxID=38942 RepID=UPI0021622C6B|nr:eukaryotic translation initiation factor 3 subunit B-like [Quercus robur]